jgi:hypothetical protein
MLQITGVSVAHQARLSPYSTGTGSQTAVKCRNFMADDFVFEIDLAAKKSDISNAEAPNSA